MLRLNHYIKILWREVITIQIQPMLRLNSLLLIMYYWIFNIQIQPMLRLNSDTHTFENNMHKNSNTTNVKVKQKIFHFFMYFSKKNSNTTNVKVKLHFSFCICWHCAAIQIQPMLRLNVKLSNRLPPFLIFKYNQC